MAHLLTLLRLMFAVAVTAILVAHAEPSRIADAFSRVSPAWLAGALALVAIDRALMAYRWIALLEPSARPGVGRLVRIFFESSFIGSFLPSVGGDAARAWSLSRDGVSGAGSLASVLMDRLLGIVSVLGCGLLGLALARPAGSRAMLTASLTVGGAVCAGALALIFSSTVDRGAREVLRRLEHRPLVGSVARLLDALQNYRRRTAVLARVLVASVGVQLLRATQAWMLGCGLGLTVPLFTYVAFVPIVVLVMMVPVTISGFGTGNLAFVALFGQAGVSAADAFALSMLFLGLGLLGTLPGAVLYVGRTLSRGRR